MHQDRRPPTRRGAPPAAEGPAVEDHGRVVTATAQAAAFYRQAQQAADWSQVVAALRHSVDADPAFGLAVADLDAITQEVPSLTSGQQMNWERHHTEVVRTAAAGNLSRAADLLRDHLASVGCDPLALRIVADLGQRTGRLKGLQDLVSAGPRCHTNSWNGGDYRKVRP
jgi:hypothetical protein